MSDEVKALYEIFLKHPVVTTDSRDIPAGSLFFALRGGKFDGNRYAADALEKGAAYAVVDRAEVAVSDKYILVEDTLATLQNLATYHRRVLGIPILAITGSNGKTTTKELLARILARRFNVSVTEGNLNNHIGVPLTLLRMNASTEFGIVEMGASAQGEIALLCSIAQPNFGVITNIGKSHLEGFGNIEGVEKGKGELFDWLGLHHGTAFYLKEDTVLERMVFERDGLRAVGYSVHEADGIQSRLNGEYNRYNIAAAVAVGHFFGVGRREMEIEIAGYIPENKRSQRIETDRNVLTLDCYNANPSSMEAALDNFIKEGSPLEKAVILGDMLELGEYSGQEHKAIVDNLAASGIKNVFLVGSEFTAAGNGHTFLTFPDVDALRDYLSGHRLEDNIILIKGSRGIGLEKVVDLL